MRRTKADWDRILFAGLETLVLELGFTELTPEFIEKEKTELGLKEPLFTTRIKDVENQVIFQKWVKDYSIVLITSFDRNKRMFTEKGRIWIHVVYTPEDKKHYTRYFRRIGIGFMENVKLEIEFLNTLLFIRPLDKNNKPMRIWQNLKKGELYWKSFHSNERKDVKQGLRLEIVEHVDSMLKQKGYYFTIRREKLGIKHFERDLRKKWDKKAA